MDEIVCMFAMEILSIEKFFDLLWQQHLQLRPRRSHDEEESVTHEGIADVLMRHKCVGEEVLSKEDYMQQRDTHTHTHTHKTRKTRPGVIWD